MSDVPVVHVHIFGTEYRIESEADPDHTRKVARHVDAKMREIANSLSLRSISKIAVLAAVNLADELLKEEEVGQELERSVGENADRLTEAMGRHG